MKEQEIIDEAVQTTLYEAITSILRTYDIRDAEKILFLVSRWVAIEKHRRESR